VVVVVVVLAVEGPGEGVKLVNGNRTGCKEAINGVLRLLLLATDGDGLLKYSQPKDGVNGR
jgi:hypothetical protein